MEAEQTKIEHRGIHSLPLKPPPSINPVQSAAPLKTYLPASQPHQSASPFKTNTPAAQTPHQPAAPKHHNMAYNNYNIPYQAGIVNGSVISPVRGAPPVNPYYQPSLGRGAHSKKHGSGSIRSVVQAPGMNGKSPPSTPPIASITGSRSNFHCVVAGGGNNWSFNGNPYYQAPYANNVGGNIAPSGAYEVKNNTGYGLPHPNNSNSNSSIGVPPVVQSAISNPQYTGPYPNHSSGSSLPSGLQSANGTYFQTGHSASTASFGAPANTSYQFPGVPNGNTTPTGPQVLNLHGVHSVNMYVQPAAANGNTSPATPMITPAIKSTTPANSRSFSTPSRLVLDMQRRPSPYSLTFNPLQLMQRDLRGLKSSGGSETEGNKLWNYLHNTWNTMRELNNKVFYERTRCRLCDQVPLHEHSVQHNNHHLSRKAMGMWRDLQAELSAVNPETITMDIMEKFYDKYWDVERVFWEDDFSVTCAATTWTGHHA